MALRPSKLILHNRVTSNSCARVRIAAFLKSATLEIVQPSPHYREKNPGATVPILEAHYENGKPLIMTQSFSMLEFLEETYPHEPRLIPPVTDMAARSKVRDLALLMACDLQPLLSQRVLSNLKRLSFDQGIRGPRNGSSYSWEDEATRSHAHHLRRKYTTPVVKLALKAYNDIAKQSAGKFSVGDKVSIADICLVPLITSILNFRTIRLETEYPTIARIMETCQGMDAFQLQGVPLKPTREKSSPSSRTDDIPQVDHATATAANS